ncbi:helix-turn-helix domain-containing protein [Burkholderia alba]|uniref:helix-turn-helix domain-containing protein n=1 Tax=Burkholderia alba TaxID=2683677 RepID=UPI002B05AC93|nr:RodZ domain-containing protein [Burkholderia alba]
MSEPQPSKGAETNAGQKPAPAGFESLAAVGARLAQLREAKGWSVDDVSARLKVAPPKLRALEAGDISHLPGATFALGVVRSYAKMLGVDPEPFAQALRREKGVPEVDLSMPASAGTDLPRGRVSIPLGGSSSRHRSWLWAAAAAVLAVIAAAMWHTGGESSNWLARFKSGGTEGASAVQAQPEAAASDASASDAIGGAASGVTAVSAQDASAAAVASVPASAVPAAVSAPASAVASVPVASAPVVVGTAASSADAASVAVAAGQSVVELKVTQDCWFSVRDKNGKEVFSALVRAGEVKQVAGDAPLKVTIGNKAGLDAISFDGKSVDPAKYSTARGNVARFTLP